MVMAGEDACEVKYGRGDSLEGGSLWRLMPCLRARDGMGGLNWLGVSTVYRGGCQ